MIGRLPSIYGRLGARILQQTKQIAYVWYLCHIEVQAKKYRLVQCQHFPCHPNWQVSKWYWYYLFFSKGNFGYPPKGILAVVPQILPHIPLHNQGYPTFPFEFYLKFLKWSVLDLGVSFFEKGCILDCRARDDFYLECLLAPKGTVFFFPDSGLSRWLIAVFFSRGAPK